MTIYVPVICLVPAGIADRLAKRSEDPAASMSAGPLAEVMERNGWTPEKLVGGVALSMGVEAATHPDGSPS